MQSSTRWEAPRALAWGLLALAVLALVFRDLQGAGEFDGGRAFADVEYQVQLGPRVPGSAAHERTVEWIVSSLRSAGWDTEVLRQAFEGKVVLNVAARRGEGPPSILVGAHYDSRMFADLDPDPEVRDLPVPGANDGASGVAVLLELARVLPRQLDKEIWLVFFDAEDNGGIPGWDWILGSRAFARDLQADLDAVVIVDMVGDAELTLPIEGNSDPELAREIWQVAASLGYGEIFRNEVRYYILDDHVPFLERGIPSVDIIDLDYPFWHTLADTPDKVSAESLKAVGDTLLAWLLTP